VLDSGFNLDQWSNSLRRLAKNREMKILVGLPGSPSAADSGYVSPGSLPVGKLKSFENFAGVMIWDVQAAEQNNNFQDGIKAVLG